MCDSQMQAVQFPSRTPSDRSETYRRGNPLSVEESELHRLSLWQHIQQVRLEKQQLELEKQQLLWQCRQQPQQKRKRPCKNKRAAAKAAALQTAALQAGLHLQPEAEAEEGVEEDATDVGAAAPSPPAAASSSSWVVVAAPEADTSETPETRAGLEEPPSSEASEAPALKEDGGEDEEEDEAEGDTSDAESLSQAAVNAALSDFVPSQMQVDDVRSLLARVRALELHAAQSQLQMPARLEKLEASLQVFQAQMDKHTMAWDLARANQQLEALMKEKAVLRLDQRISAVEAVLEKEQAATSKINAKLQEVEAKIATDTASCDERLAAAETALKEEVGALAQLQSQLGSLQESLAAAEDACDAKCNEMKAEVRNLQTSFQDIRSKADAFTVLTTNLRKMERKIDSNVASESQTRSTLQWQSYSLKKLQADTQQQLKALEQQFGKNSAEVSRQMPSHELKALSQVSSRSERALVAQARAAQLESNGTETHYTRVQTPWKAPSAHVTINCNVTKETFCRTGSAWTYGKEVSLSMDELQTIGDLKAAIVAQSPDATGLTIEQVRLHTGPKSWPDVMQAQDRIDDFVLKWRGLRAGSTHTISVYLLLPPH